MPTRSVNVVRGNEHVEELGVVGEGERLICGRDERVASAATRKDEAEPNAGGSGCDAAAEHARRDTTAGRGADPEVLDRDALGAVMREALSFEVAVLAVLRGRKHEYVIDERGVARGR